jgi:hypothetical protein
MPPPLRPTKNALNAALRSVSSAMPGSASVIFLPNIPGTRPSILCTTSVGDPRSRTICWNSWSTDLGSPASEVYRRTPCVFSRSSRTALSGFLAAIPTRIPRWANSLAQLALMPGPPPTTSHRPRVRHCLMSRRRSLRRPQRCECCGNMFVGPTAGHAPHHLERVIRRGTAMLASSWFAHSQF